MEIKDNINGIEIAESSQGYIENKKYNNDKNYRGRGYKEGYKGGYKKNYNNNFNNEGGYQSKGYNKKQFFNNKNNY